MYEQILYEVDDPVATITLNRPEFLNAWTAQMGLEFRHAMSRAQNDRAVVGIIVTGAGRGFCSGADMKALTDVAQGGWKAGQDPIPPQLESDPGDRTWGEDFTGEHTWIMSVPKPVIAAINGPIVGRAVVLALTCDIRIMSEDAILTTAFSQRGLVAEWGVSWLLPRLVGPATALDLLMSSRRIDGREAERIGLVNKAVPAHDVVASARSYIQDLASTCAPTAIAVIKRQVYEQLHCGLGEAERNARRLMAESFQRTDMAEGVQSFVERRPPRFLRIGY